MKLIVLGTGNGGALKCYNTCFCIENNDKHFLVDGGGGNQILAQLEKAKINLLDIHDIFISHNHIDHSFGLMWVLRIISYQGKGEYRIYGSSVSINALKTMQTMLFSKLNDTERIKFIVVNDDETKQVCGLDITFFDTQAKKDRQFGFTVKNNLLAFAGDEPLDKELYSRVKNCQWLLHEAFCLEKERYEFSPHKKGHCTVKDAALIAQEVGAKNLVLWHTEDNALETRKDTYTAEAKQYFKGNVFVPDDLEVIDIKE